MTTFILLAPLVGAILTGFGWRLIGETAATWLATAILVVCAALAWVVFLNFDGTTQHIPLMRWIESGTLATEWAVRLDRLTAIMLIVICTVSALVHVYSLGYMAHDDNFAHDESYRPRFFAYLSFFTFAMLMLVTADNLLQLFFGWEGVGVASYLLIGFYFRKNSANAAAMKAFIVNRVGDAAFLLAMFALYLLTDSLRFDDVFAAGPHLAGTTITFLWRDWTASEVVATLLFLGAMGKSAQLFLHTWLPDAMEGPTPVSALIHAATMVTAGVFLVCRMSPIIEYAPMAKQFIMFIGAATAFFAATVGLVQNDIKRVIAYSTCSQLGYMFVAAGAGIYGAAMFHLFTHAFFKALLFLGAGSVIHAMHHEQDMRNYGGLHRYIPYTYWAMMIGTLAITGVGLPLTYIGFAGFLSKDAIIESAWASGNGFAFWALVLAAAMTSFYSWRLIFLTFFGDARWGQHHAPDDAQAGHGAIAHDSHEGQDYHGHGHGHVHGHDYGHGVHTPHESPGVMLVPLAALALGAIFAGMLWHKQFFGDHETMVAFFGMPHHVAAPAADGVTDDAAASDTGHAETAADAANGMDHAPAALGAIYMSAGSEAVLDRAHHAPPHVKASPFLAMLFGLALAYWMYIERPDMPRRLAAANAPLYRFLLNKWYFDEIYDAVFVRPAQAIGRLFWKGGDGAAIDGTLNGVAMGIVPAFTRLAGRAQSGYVFHYAFTMVLGLALLLSWFAITGGAR